MTSIDVSQKGDLICAGSADMTLKVVNRETFKDTLFKGHSAPVLSVAINAAADVVASSSCDGSVKLWSVSEARCLKTFGSLWKESNDSKASEVRGTISWSMTSNELAIPSRDSVKLVTVLGSGADFREDSIKAPTLSDGELLSTTCWSKSGAFVAAATTQGRIFVWNRREKNPVTSLQTSTKQHLW